MSDAPTHSYFWTFEHGPGPWQTWHSPSVIAGDDIGAFTRFQAPGVLDPNHLDGIGALRLAMYLPIEAPVGSPGVLNLVDAELEITLRTTDFDARGAELLVWLSAYLPSDQIEFDYPIATTNWAYTGKNLLDGVNSEWTTVTVLVGEDPTDWTYAGINRTLQGDWALRYQELDLAATLANVNATLHLAFVSGDPDAAPKGFLDVASIELRTQTPAVPLPEAIIPAEEYSGLEDEVLAGTLQGEPAFGVEQAIYRILPGTNVSGSLVLDERSGAFEYTPAADFYGYGTFRYTVENALEVSSERAVAFYVGPVNDRPVASTADESMTIAGGQTFRLSLLKGSDPDNDRLTFHLVPDAAVHGAVTLDAQTGRYEFLPEAGYSGAAGFQYVVSDGQATSDPKEVLFVVAAEGTDVPLPSFDSIVDEYLLAGDYAGFLKYMILLADAGNRDAAYHYGTALNYGNQVTPNAALARAYLESAASRVPDANLQLATLYLSGEGGDKNVTAARALLEALPQDGQAVYRLATLNDMGLGAPADPALAAAGYLQAALLGNVDATYTLGRRYLSGEGVDASPSGAYFWLTLSQRLGAGSGIWLFHHMIEFDVARAMEQGLSTAQVAVLDGIVATWTTRDPVPMFGGNGPDTFAGRAGDDIIFGGLGADVMDYSGSPDGVVVDLAAQRAHKDGYGNVDQLYDLANVVGSAFEDLIVGDAAANVLRGGAGRDVLIGRGGDDVLYGGEVLANELYGGPGDDRYIVEVAGDTIVELPDEGSDAVETALPVFRRRVSAVYRARQVRRPG
jgi:hypothetical protein